MNIYFRVDASMAIGTGHVMRCLNFAHELKKQGNQCFFISESSPGNLLGKITQEGFDVIPIKTTCSDTFHWEDDVQATILIIAQVEISWLIIDHYQIDERWHKSVAKYCEKIFVIDDLANRPHYCSVLLDGNVSRKKIDYQSLIPETCELLIGADYLLLDPLCFNAYESERHGSLCFLGGGDNQKDFKKIIPLFSSLLLPQPITCVFGENQPDAESLMDLCQEHDCHSMISPNDFKALCQTALFAIVRCGLVSYELAAFKTANVAIYKKGIHEEVVRWLEMKDYTAAITIDDFLDPDLANKSIEKALRMRPTHVLQTMPGTLKAAQHIIKSR